MEILRLFDILPYIEETYLDQDVTIAGKQMANGENILFKSTEITDKVSYALIKLGIQPKDKIASLQPIVRMEYSDMAIML